MGYGNQAPVTWKGKVMILSLGFLSILLFGLILQRAGRVTTVLFEDILSRFHVGVLSNRWFLCSFWGIIYFGYMTVNAYYITSWKKSRLGETFPIKESFWFSYISFTTIGLGMFSSPLCSPLCFKTATESFHSPLHVFVRRLFY